MSSGLTVQNAVFSSGAYDVYSAGCHINKSSSVNNGKAVYQLKFTGTITTSVAGSVANYIYIEYDGNYGDTASAYVPISNSGSFTAYIDVDDMNLGGHWYFYLNSERGSASGTAATTLSNGNVTIYYR
jgi:hypothetical protein